MWKKCANPAHDYQLRAVQTAWAVCVCPHPALSHVNLVTICITVNIKIYFSSGAFGLVTAWETQILKKAQSTVEVHKI